MKKSFYIALETNDVGFDNPSPNDIQSVMSAPEKLNPCPGINIYCRSPGMTKKEPGYKSGKLEVFFDFKGLCILIYEVFNIVGWHTLVNSNCVSNENVEIENPYGSPYFFKEKNWVPTEQAIPYILEFCDIGEISIAEKEWESWS